MRPQRQPPPPLDGAALERLALRYVERYATTRAKLVRYLTDKIRLRGWAEERAADADGLAERMVALGYIDDRAFAEARAGAMARRGLGGMRVRGALRQAGIGEEDAAAIAPVIAERRVAAALAFARRKRIGPFGAPIADRAAREKQIGALIRAGHDFALARAIVLLSGDEDPEAALATFG